MNKDFNIRINRQRIWIENILQKKYYWEKGISAPRKTMVKCSSSVISESWKISKSLLVTISKVTMKLHNVQILCCISNVKEIYPKTECIGSVLKGGHDVQIGTMVFVNLWSLHNDADVWKDVEIFDPYFYLDKNGKLDAKPSNWLPFGTGRSVSRGAVS